MSGNYEISEAMIRAAIAAGKAAGAFPEKVRAADVRRILSSGLSQMHTELRAAKYDILVSTTLETKRARIIGLGNRRCYFRVECEDGQVLTVHGNDIYSSGRRREG